MQLINIYKYSYASIWAQCVVKSVGKRKGISAFGFGGVACVINKISFGKRKDSIACISLAYTPTMRTVDER